ncbi:MAG TPA: hypothetical protein VKR31_17125 [Rhizomicrobium sp.]|nr:hypothetical protein [Rhizomicrobium sp.]
MTSILAATVFLLTFVVLPGPISRLVGAKFAAMFLATTGFVVFPVILGPNWGSVLVAALDIALLLVGAKLANHFGFSRAICAIVIKRVAALVSAVLCILFVVLALMVASLAGHAIEAFPYDFLALVSGIGCAALLSRRQEQVLTRGFAGSLVSASSQA